MGKSNCIQRVKRCSFFQIANANSTPPIPDNLSPPQRDVLLRCLETVKEQRPTAKELLIHPLFTQYMKIS